MSTNWIACELISGRYICDLPEVRGSVSDVLGAYTSTSVKIPIPLSKDSPVYLGDRFASATHPWRVMLVRVVNDVPLWGGIVTGYKGGSDGTADVAVATLGNYLDVRFVGDHVYEGVDEATIAAGLIADAQVEGIGFVVDAPPTGVTRDRTYNLTDNATVYKRLNELCDVEDGLEWAIELAWTPARDGIVKNLKIRNRIGNTAPVGVFAAYPAYGTKSASEATYTFTADYSRENFANHVTAYSSGQGDAQPVSAPARTPALNAGLEPRVERRYQPSSGISDQDTLDAHATTEAARMQAGAQTWEIKARADAYPRVGLEWRPGDTVRAELVGHLHPGGVTITRRAMGYQLADDGTITPQLIDA